MNRIFGVAFIVAAFALCGCDNKSDNNAKNQEKAKAAEKSTTNATARLSYAELPMNAVLAVVGKHEFSKAICEENVTALVDLFKKKRPKASIKTIDRVSRQMRLNALSRFVISATISADAEAKGIKPTSAQQQRMEAKYARAFGRKKDDFKKMEARLTSVQRSAIKRMFDAELMVETYLENIHGPELIVSDSQLSNQVAQTIRYNAAMAQTNAIALAAASNALARARSGEDFGKLADELSQDPEKKLGGDIGFKSAGDYLGDDVAYWRAVSALKPGEITDVLTTSEGYEIVKFSGKTRVDEDETEEFKNQRRLSRILWRRAIIFDVNPQFIRREMIAERRNEVLEKALGELAQKYPVSYPYGKDVMR